MSQTHLDWDQFVVFTTGVTAMKSSGWKASDKVFSAETCARHIYLGQARDFDVSSIGPAFGEYKKTNYFTGLDAYRFFVEFFIGLKGHYHSEKEAAGQVRKAWNVFTEHKPDEARILYPYMEAIFHDGTSVMESITKNFFRRPTFVNRAVAAANMTPDSSVLVIGGAANFTRELMVALGRKRPSTPNVITITHEDSRALRDLATELKSLTGKERITAEIQTVTFPEAMRDDGRHVTSMFSANTVFVCQPLAMSAGTHAAEVSGQIFDAWNLRQLTTPGHNAQLLQLKEGNLKEATKGGWSDPNSAPYISYATLKEMHLRHLERVESVTERAKQAIEVLGQARRNGDRAVAIQFNPDSEGMPLHFVWARRPLGNPRAQKAFATEEGPAVAA